MAAKQELPSLKKTKEAIQKAVAATNVEKIPRKKEAPSKKAPDQQPPSTKRLSEKEAQKLRGEAVAEINNIEEEVHLSAAQKQQLIYIHASEAVEQVQLALEQGNPSRAQEEAANLFAWTTFASPQESSKYKELFRQVREAQRQANQELLLQNAAKQLHQLEQVGFVEEVGALQAAKFVLESGYESDEAAVIDKETDEQKKQKEQKKLELRRKLDQEMALLLQKVEAAPADVQFTLTLKLLELQSYVKGGKKLEKLKVKQAIMDYQQVVDKYLQSKRQELTDKKALAKEEAGSALPEKAEKAGEEYKLEEVKSAANALNNLAAEAVASSEEDPKKATQIKFELRPDALQSEHGGGAPDAAQVRTAVDTQPATAVRDNTQEFIDLLGLGAVGREALPGRLRYVLEMAERDLRADPSKIKKTEWLRQLKERVEHTYKRATMREVENVLGVSPKFAGELLILQPDQITKIMTLDSRQATYEKIKQIFGLSDKAADEVFGVDRKRDTFKKQARNDVVKKIVKAVKEGQIEPIEPEVAKPVLEQIEKVETELLREKSAIPRHLEDQWRLVGKDLKAAGELLHDVSESVLTPVFRDEAMTEAPAAVRAFMSSLHASLDGTGLKANVLRAQLDDYMQNDENSKHLSVHKNQIDSILSILNRRDNLDTQIRDEAARIDPRLDQAGISDKRLEGVYNEIRQKGKFIELLNEAIQKNMVTTDGIDYVQKFFEEKSGDILHLNDLLLSVADSDREAFFEHLFTSFYHEPIYANLVTGLAEIHGAILQKENDGQIINVEIKKFDRKAGDYKIEKVSLSKAIERLREQVIEQKDWVRSTHNLYVAWLNGAPLETLANYAKHLKTSSLNTFFENDPILEEARRHAIHFLRVAGGINRHRYPIKPIFTMDPQSREIPIDEFVKEMLRKDHKLEAWQERRYASLIRGWILGVGGEGASIMKEWGPAPQEGGAPFTGYLGPLEELNFLNYIVRRFNVDLPSHDYLWTPIRGEGTMGYWSVKKDLELAIKNQEKYKLRELPKVITQQMYREGIPFILFDTTNSGFIEDRMGWRKDMHIDYWLDDNGNFLITPDMLSYTGEIDRKKLKEAMAKRGFGIKAKRHTLDMLMTVSLTEANRSIEDWYPTDPGNYLKGKEAKERNKLREKVLTRLRDIAPHEFILIERDLMDHRALWRYYVDRQDGSGMVLDDRKIEHLLLEAGRVSNYIMEKTRPGKPVTIHDLTEADWERLFGDEKECKEMQQFLNDLQEVANSVIFNRIYDRIKKIWRENGKVKYRTEEVENSSKAPWREAEVIKMETSNLSVSRYSDWTHLGEKVVPRMYGDNVTLSEGEKKYWKGAPVIMKDYRAQPEKAHEEKYTTFLKLLDEKCQSVQDVHGVSSSKAEQATRYRTGYSRLYVFDRYFKKSIGARMPFGIGTVAGYLDEYSSYAHRDAGVAGVLQLDEQNERVLGDQAAKYGIVAPLHGHSIVKDSVKKRKWKETPLARIPGIDRVIDLEKSPADLPLPIPFSYKYKVDKTHWHLANLRGDTGSRNIQVAIDIVRSYLPWLIFLLILSSTGKILRGEED